MEAFQGQHLFHRHCPDFEEGSIMGDTAVLLDWIKGENLYKPPERNVQMF